MSLGEGLRRVVSTDAARRLGWALLALLLVFLWLNMVRRVVDGPSGTQSVYWLKTRPPDRPEWRLLLGTSIVSAALLATGIARLPQALSLPFLGAVVLFAGVAVSLVRYRSAGRTIGGWRVGDHASG